MSDKVAVGIDLGTTNSCIAICKADNQIEVLINRQGRYTTPSQVTFSDGAILVGEPAKSAAEEGEDLANTAFNAKRLIGRSYREWMATRSNALAQNWPFKIVEQNNRPVYRVQHEGRAQHFTPEQISSFVLKEIKEAAEEFWGSELKRAVISVPAYFNTSQRKGTQEAAEMAGFQVLQLCSEPAMAGIAHNPMQQIYHERNLVVFDCGGGTTDVAIMKIMEDGGHSIEATSGDMNLGGETIVDCMINHYLEKLKSEKGRDFTGDPQAYIRLRTASEKAKNHLSTANTCNVRFEYDGVVVSWRLSVSEFENLIASILDKMAAAIDDAMTQAGMEVDDIAEVLLAGGTSRIPALKTRIDRKFGANKVKRTINPDHAIAQGAAVMAAALMGNTSSPLCRRRVSEILPLSLNIGLVMDELFPMIRRGTPMPATVTEIFGTSKDDQSSISITVYEGERALVNDSRQGLLGHVKLDGLPPKRQGQLKIHVKFSVDASGILTVSVKEPEVSGREALLKINEDQMQRETVSALIKDAQRHAAVDSDHRERLKKLNEFRTIVFQRKHKEMDQPNQKARIVDHCTDTIKWIDEHHSSVTLAEIEKRKTDFNSYLRTLENN